MAHSINRTLLFIFVFLLILFYFIFTTNPYGLVKHFRITMIILCLMTLFGFLIFIEYYTHQEIYKSDTHHELWTNFIKYLYKYTLYLFYFLVVAGIAYGVYKTVEKGLVWSFQISFWISIGLLILSLAMFSQMTRDITFDSPTLELLKTLIMYIPCLITDAIDYMKKDYANTPSTVFIVFLLLVLYLFVFYLIPLLQKMYYRDGVLLIDKPIYLNQNILSMTSDELKEKIVNSRPFYDRWFQTWALKIQREREENQANKVESDSPIQLEGQATGESITFLVPPDSITYPYYQEAFTSLSNQDQQFIPLDQFKQRIGSFYDSSLKDAFSDETAEERMHAFMVEHPEILTVLEKFNYLYAGVLASRDAITSIPLGSHEISKYIYHYALTSWVYLQKTEASGRQLIYSFGSRPSLYYQPYDSSLEVILNFGTSEEKILYKTTKVLFQRWNFIVMNYNYGTLDLFINNNLVGTYPDIVTQLDPQDLLIVGSSKNKNIGGICNMKYYELPIGSRKINSIYTAFHNKKIPV